MFEMPPGRVSPLLKSRKGLRGHSDGLEVLEISPLSHSGKAQQFCLIQVTHLLPPSTDLGQRIWDFGENLLWVISFKGQSLEKSWVKFWHIEFTSFPKHRYLMTPEKCWDTWGVHTGQAHTFRRPKPGLAAWDQAGSPRGPQEALGTNIQTTESQCA